MTWNDWVIPASGEHGISRLKIALPACLLGLAGVAYFLLTSRPFGLPYDDAYSTLEFARNMASTGRLTFDGVHTVAGTSTLLHILLLSIPAKLGWSLEISDAVLGICFFVLLIERITALAIYFTESREAALYAALMTAATGYFFLDALNGLETTLFMFLTVTCVGSLFKYFSRNGSPFWPAFWLFLCALGRPEGYWLTISLLFYIAVLAYCQRARTQAVIKVAGAMAIAVALALTTQRIVCGSFLPHTALAKVYFFAEYKLSLVDRLLLYVEKMKEVWAALALMLVPMFLVQRARPLLAAISGWLIIAQVMPIKFLPSSIAAYEGRYVHPLMPFLFVFAGDGVAFLLRTARQRGIPRWPAWALVPLVACICYLNMLAVFETYDNEKIALHNNHFWAADWLQTNAPPGITIATHDIGVLRYYGRFNVIDIAGLVDEEANARNKAQKGQFDYMLERRPDYIVADGWWLWKFAHYPPAIRRYVTVVAESQPNAVQVVHLRIYKCNWDGNKADQTATPSNNDKPKGTIVPVEKPK